MQGQVADKPRIYVVDDDRNFLTALRRFLSAEGFDVAAFESPVDFLAAHDPARPGCLLLDLKMAEMSGLDVQSCLMASGEKRPLIFITGEHSIPASVTAMKRGARDYLTKPVDPAVLLSAIREAMGEDTRQRTVLTGHTELLTRWRALTLRERQVLKCVAQGQLNKQIAFDLSLSERTVKAHRGRAMKKMKARSPADLVQMAAQIGPRLFS
jgi:FixJ family two-component response regulator